MEPESTASIILSYSVDPVPYYLVTVVQPYSENVAPSSFNYDLEGFTDRNGNNLSDDDIKKLMKSWTLQEFQDWFGFTHLDSYTGDSK